MGMSRRKALQKARYIYGRTAFARKFPEPQDGKQFKIGRATILGGHIGYIAMGSGHTFEQAFGEARRRAGNMNPLG